MEEKSHRKLRSGRPRCSSCSWISSARGGGEHDLRAGLGAGGDALHVNVYGHIWSWEFLYPEEEMITGWWAL